MVPVQERLGGGWAEGSPPPPLNRTGCLPKQLLGGTVRLLLPQQRHGGGGRLQRGLGSRAAGAGKGGRVVLRAPPPDAFTRELLKSWPTAGEGADSAPESPSSSGPRQKHLGGSTPMWCLLGLWGQCWSRARYIWATPCHPLVGSITCFCKPPCPGGSLPPLPGLIEEEEEGPAASSPGGPATGHRGLCRSLP